MMQTFGSVIRVLVVLGYEKFLQVICIEDVIFSAAMFRARALNRVGSREL